LFEPGLIRKGKVVYMQYLELCKYLGDGTVTFEKGRKREEILK